MPPVWNIDEATAQQHGINQYLGVWIKVDAAEAYAHHIGTTLTSVQLMNNEFTPGTWVWKHTGLVVAADYTLEVNVTLVGGTSNDINVTFRGAGTTAATLQRIFTPVVAPNNHGAVVVSAPGFRTASVDITAAQFDAAYPNNLVVNVNLYHETHLRYNVVFGNNINSSVTVAANQIVADAPVSGITTPAEMQVPI